VVSEVKRRSSASVEAVRSWIAVAHFIIGS
jgi:hypothetical protein